MVDARAGKMCSSKGVGRSCSTRLTEITCRPKWRAGLVWKKIKLWSALTQLDPGSHGPRRCTQDMCENDSDRADALQVESELMLGTSHASALASQPSSPSQPQLSLSHSPSPPSPSSVRSCRICFDTEIQHGDRWISPCRCRGTMKVCT